MMVFLAGLGAILAGLFLAWRDGLPWLEARRTGVIRARGESGRKVARADDPDRFAAMLDRRRKGLLTGALIALAGLLFIAWQALGFILAAPPAA